MKKRRQNYKLLGRLLAMLLTVKNLITVGIYGARDMTFQGHPEQENGVKYTSDITSYSWLIVIVGLPFMVFQIFAITLISGKQNKDGQYATKLVVFFLGCVLGLNALATARVISE